MFSALEDRALRYGSPYHGGNQDWRESVYAGNLDDVRGLANLMKELTGN